MKNFNSKCWVLVEAVLTPRTLCIYAESAPKFPAITSFTRTLWFCHRISLTTVFQCKWNFKVPQSEAQTHWRQVPVERTLNPNRQLNPNPRIPSCKSNKNFPMRKTKNAFECSLFPRCLSLFMSFRVLTNDLQTTARQTLFSQPFVGRGEKKFKFKCSLWFISFICDWMRAEVGRTMDGPLIEFP
jgi:hypothetical protein